MNLLSVFAPLNKIKRRQLRRCNPHHEITSSLKIANQAANPSSWCVMQTIYVHLFTILFICLFLYRMCWNFYFFGGGCLLKKLIDADLLRNKKNIKKKRMLQLNFMLCSFKLFLLNQCFICNSYENVDSDEIIF